MKPNKPIMIFGIATMTFITSYFAYTQATTENKEVDRQYDQLYGEGAAKYMRERRVNKWE